MTADRIDMSLEDIIKSNRKAATASKIGGAGARGRGRVGGGGGRGQERAKGGSRSRSRGRIPPVKKSGRVGNFKSRSRSRKRQEIGGGGLRRVKSTGSITRSRSRSQARGSGGMTSVSSGHGQASARSGKLIISNLEAGVSDGDIQELFAEFGLIKSAALHYDRNGKSLGSADVVYERYSDSIKAMKQYDGVPLDGRPMKIEMAAPQNIATRSEQNRSRSSSRPRRQTRSRSLGRIRGGRVAKRGVVKGYKGLTGKKVARKGVKVMKNVSKQKKKKTLPVSRETLDKEIETFMKSR